MIPNGSDFESLVQRVAKLEQQHRRLKKFLLIGLISLAAVILMAQATTTQHIIEANEFRVKDASGKTVATLGGTQDYGLIVYDSYGKPTTVLDANGLLISDLVSHKQSVVVAAGSSIDALISSAWLTGQFALQGKVATFSTTGITLNGEVSGIEPPVTLEADENGGRLEIRDKQGFASVVGNAKLEAEQTGETLKTSAAALVLFGKKGKVIWRAP